MLSPTVVDDHRGLYPVGSTPATSLTRSLPQGEEALILVLGSGDLRDILYTAYSEQEYALRGRYDFTCTDTDAAVIARNVVLLSFLVDGVDDGQRHLLWDIYYEPFIGEAAMSLLQPQIEKLLKYTESLHHWRSSPHGSLVTFCDPGTLEDFRSMLVQYSVVVASKDSDTSLATYAQHIRRVVEGRETGGNGDTIIAAVQAAGPLGSQAKESLRRDLGRFWGSCIGQGHENSAKGAANPIFAASISASTVLPGDAEPLLGFHLAAAYADLTTMSPLRISTAEAPDAPRAVQAAKTQFNAWVKALEAMCTRVDFVIRYSCSDAIAFCQTLQTSRTTQAVSANWYRGHYTMQPLVLDDVEYVAEQVAPRRFHVVDASNLAGRLSTLDVLISATPLLSNAPFALVHTATRATEVEDRSLLAGHIPTMSLLVGMSPIEYWAHSTTVSSVDELMLTMRSAQPPQAVPLHVQVSWKKDSWFSGIGQVFVPIFIQAHDLADLLYSAWTEMASRELDDASASRAFYHCGSLVALAKHTKERIRTDWLATWDLLDVRLTQGAQDASHGWNPVPEFKLFTELFSRDVLFSTWIPSQTSSPLLAVTLVVPRDRVDHLLVDAKQQTVPPMFQVRLRDESSTDAVLLSCVHTAFGYVQQHGERHSKNFALSVHEDRAGWSSTAPLVASLYIPQHLVADDQRQIEIALAICTHREDASQNAPAPTSPRFTVLETTLGDDEHVFISDQMPGLRGYPRVGDGLEVFKPVLSREDMPDAYNRTFSVDAVHLGQIFSLRSRVDMQAELGSQLLKTRAHIGLEQVSPFSVNIVFDHGTLAVPVSFPLPVDQNGIKSRVARTSGYIELIAPIAEPVASPSLAEFILPSRLTHWSGHPVIVHSAPLVNLGALPILDVSKPGELSWLTTLTSMQFSARERRIRREEQQDDKHGISRTHLRNNLKETLFTLFMLASGSQGGQSGLFALRGVDNSGIHALFFVSAIRLDGASRSAVADAAVLPLTTEKLGDPALKEFLILCRALEMVEIEVDPQELLLWKKVLPALAERCRTWAHAPGCEYARDGATAPLSEQVGGRVLCSCGEGRLPDDFVALPGWEVAKAHSTRVAISPLFPVPLVEELVDAADRGAMAAEENADYVGRGEAEAGAEAGLRGAGASEGPPAGGPPGPPGPDPAVDKRCRNCGATRAPDGGRLKRCTRCLVAVYCSADCQKKDWRRHRGECEESEAHRE